MSLHERVEVAESKLEKNRQYAHFMVEKKQHTLLQQKVLQGSLLFHSPPVERCSGIRDQPPSLDPPAARQDMRWRSILAPKVAEISSSCGTRVCCMGRLLKTTNLGSPPPPKTMYRTLAFFFRIFY